MNVQEDLKTCVKSFVFAPILNPCVSDGGLISLELNPNRLDAYQNRGKAKLALGDKIGACADYKKGASKGNKQLVEFLNSWRGGWCQKM